jgi:hypothetical protein
MVEQSLTVGARGLAPPAGAAPRRQVKWSFPTVQEALRNYGVQPILWSYRQAAREELTACVIG